MPQPYKSPVCRGSFMLRTACGHCERCRDTLGEVFQKNTHPTAATVDVPNYGAGGLVSGPTTGEPITGLPVAGYKKTQPPEFIALVNENKRLEEMALRQIDKHAALEGLDQRSVSLARTKIQEAYMWLNRGVFQPQRLEGDL